MKRLHILTAAGALAAALPVLAEEPALRTEINVDRTVVPVQRPASPLGSVRPSILSPETETRTLRPAEYSRASSFDNVITPLGAVDYTGLRGLSPYRGYAAIGYFPSFQLGASAGYRFIRKEKTSLGAWLQYDGSSYKAHGGVPKNDKDERQTVSSNIFTVGADFLQRVGASTRLNAALDYTYGSLKLPFAANPGQSKGESRSLSAFNGSLSLHSTLGPLAWHIGADFDHFSEGKELLTQGAEGPRGLEGASENLTGVRLGGFAKISKAAYAGVEASAQFLHRSRGLLLLETGSANDAIASPVYPVTSGAPDRRTSSIVKVMPYFGIQGRNVNARLGLDVGFPTVNLGSHVHVAPNVLLDWNPASTVAVYARFSGGDSFNSLRSLYTRMGAFAPGSYVYTSSNTPVDARFGINIGPFRGVSLELYGGYASTHNALMPVALAYGGAEAPQGAFLNVNLSGWRAGGALGYTWREYVKARASFEILPHSYTSGFADAWDRARTVTKVELGSKPLENLDLGLVYELRTGRRYYSIPVAAGLNLTPEARSLRNVSKLDFRGQYHITETVTLGIAAENLLCRRVEQLPWVPGNGLTGLVSVEVKF